MSASVEAMVVAVMLVEMLGMEAMLEVVEAGAAGDVVGILNSFVNLHQKIGPTPRKDFFSFEGGHIWKSRENLNFVAEFPIPRLPLFHCLRNLREPCGTIHQIHGAWMIFSHSLRHAF